MPAVNRVQGTRAVEVYYDTQPVAKDVKELVFWIANLGTAKQPISRIELLVQVPAKARKVPTCRGDTLSTITVDYSSATRCAPI